MQTEIYLFDGTKEIQITKNDRAYSAESFHLFRSKVSTGSRSEATLSKQ